MNKNKILFILITLISFKPISAVQSHIQSSFPKTHYIALNGSDKNNGSINQPWYSLEYAIRKVKGGDTIQFRAGIYRIDVNLQNFKTKNGIPIVIESYPNEKVVFDGTRALKADWKHWKNGIYRTKVKQNFWQLFVDREIADMARWPNTSFKNDSIWSMTKSMRSMDGGFHKGKYTGKSRFGLAYDKDFETNNETVFKEGDSMYENIAPMESLSETGIDFTDAYAVLNIGNWLTWTRKITAHKAGQPFFSYDTSGITEKELKSYGAYYIYGLAALDKVNEWWYDENSKYLYYKPILNKDIEKQDFQLRDQDFALNFLYCKDITIKKIQFFATGFFSKASDRISFENCRFDYMSANKIALGATNWFLKYNKKGKNYNYATSFYNGTDCKFINCIVSKSNAPVFLMGENMTIKNCLFEDIEWDVNSSGASGSIMVGRNNTISRCTLTRAGNSEGIRPGGVKSTIRLNRIFNVGNLQHDGSGINIGTKNQLNSLVEMNWVHDSNRQGVRFDYHGKNILNKDGAVYGDGVLRNNVTWNTQPNQIKGDRHLIINNTVINSNQYKNPFVELFNMTVHGFKAMHEIEANAHSITRNNLAKLTHRSWNLQLRGKNTEYRIRKDGYKEPKAQTLAGVNDHNTDISGAAFLYLRDPENLDFRPKEGSLIIDAGAIVAKEEIPSNKYLYNPLKIEGSAPDIGAYEWGAKHYWIPGRQLETASTPIPQDKSTAKQNADLMFLEGKNALKHTIYFGQSENKLKKIAELSDSNIYSPKKLIPGITYFWRIDTKNISKEIKGKVWSFTIARE